MKLDVMLILGGSDTKLFLQIILQNMLDKQSLDKNTKHWLRALNLPLCYQRNHKLVNEVIQTLSQLPDLQIEDMRFSVQLLHAVATELSNIGSRRGKRSENTVLFDRKTFTALKESCATLTDITDAVSSERVTSMFGVVDLLLLSFLFNPPTNEEEDKFLGKMAVLCSRNDLHKVSHQYIDNIILALNHSSRKEKSSLIKLLDTFKNNEELSSCYQNIVLQRDKYVEVSKDVHIHLFIFKHPSIMRCREPGQCGFISKHDKGANEIRLSTDKEKYSGTGLHYHDVISAHDMHLYHVWSGEVGPGIRILVPRKWSWWKLWFPDVTEWLLERMEIEYNLADFMVFKNYT